MKNKMIYYTQEAIFALRRVFGMQSPMNVWKKLFDTPALFIRREMPPMQVEYHVAPRADRIYFLPPHSGSVIRVV